MSTLHLSRVVADEFIAELTDAAYQVLLRQGLSRPFLDVELELWYELRAVFRRGGREARHAQPALAEAV